MPFRPTRRLEVIRLQNAARNSTEWFEHVPRYVGLEPIQFAYSLLTRSQTNQPRKSPAAGPHLAGGPRNLVRAACGGGGMPAHGHPCSHRCVCAD